MAAEQQFRDWSKPKIEKTGWLEQDAAHLGSCALPVVEDMLPVNQLVELLKAIIPQERFAEQLSEMRNEIKCELDTLKEEVKQIKTIVGVSKYVLSNPKKEMTEKEILNEYEKLRKKTSDYSNVDEDLLKGIL